MLKFMELITPLLPIYILSLLLAEFFPNFNSFIPIEFKCGLIYNLLYRCFRICSNFSKFHDELCILKCILSKNGYPEKVLDLCIKIFLNKIHRENKIVVDTVAKKDVYFTLPFYILKN